MGFTGFPKEFANFLFSLQFINSHELLNENKLKYKKLITEPLTQLFYELMPIVSSISKSVETKTSKCISSMYNDMRFSRGNPLKCYMYLRFREPFHEKDVLGFYFDMGYDYYSYGVRIYKQTNPGMEKIRKGILEKSELFAQEIEKIKQQGMAIYGGKFSKDHYPNIDNTMIKDILNRKSFYIARVCLISEAVFSRELVKEIAEGYGNLKEIYTLFKDVLNYG